MNTYTNTLRIKNESNNEVVKPINNAANIGLFAVFGVFFILLYIISFFKNVDYYTLAIWVLYCASVAVINLKLFLKYSIYFLYHTSNIIGVFIIENKALYLYEIGMASGRNEALLPITIIHWVFFSVIILSDNSTERWFFKDENSNIDYCFGTRKYERPTLLLVGIVFNIICVLMIIEVYHNTAFDVGLDRFQYEYEYITGIWKVLHSYIIYLIPLIVILALRGKLVYAIFSTILFCVYMIMTGNKFGVFINILALWLPFVIEKYKLHRISIKNGLIAVSFGTILGAGLYSRLYSFQSKIYGNDKSQFYTYLYNRLAQQGQMWWGIYGLDKNNGVHIRALIKSAGSILKIDKEVINNMDYGIYKMMKLITPYEVYATKIQNHSRYAYSTEASIYYYLKFFGVIVVISIFALLLVFVTNWYWRDLLYQNALCSVISGYFYLVITTLLFQSDFNYLLSRRGIMLIVAYLILYKTTVGRPCKEEISCQI